MLYNAVYEATFCKYKAEHEMSVTAFSAHAFVPIPDRAVAVIPLL